MTYTTSRGTEVDLKPLLLTDKDGWAAYRTLGDVLGELNAAESGSEAQWAARENLHTAFLGLCDKLGIPRESVGEHDITAVVSFIETGQPDTDFSQPAAAVPSAVENATSAND